MWNSARKLKRSMKRAHYKLSLLLSLRFISVELFVWRERKIKRVTVHMPINIRNWIVGVTARNGISRHRSDGLTATKGKSLYLPWLAPFTLSKILYARSRACECVCVCVHSTDGIFVHYTHALTVWFVIVICNMFLSWFLIPFIFSLFHT